MNIETDSEWNPYDIHEQEIESLRQQLAEKDAEIDRLKGECQSLAIEDTPGIQLSASQAREVQLLEALKAAADKFHYYAEYHSMKEHTRDNIEKVERNFAIARMCDEAIAIPTDTTALQVMISKAGEVMRERCVDVIGPYGKTRYLSYYEEGCDDTKAGIDTEIRAIPGVTLEDLKD